MDITEPLTALERARLKAAEDTIAAGLQTFYEVGAALMRIRDGRLYREGHRSFDAYCRERWAMGRRNADRLIESAQVYDNLSSTLLTLPASERHVVPLAQLEPADQIAAWQEAVETAPNGKVTGAHVAQVAQRYSSPPSTFDLEPGDGAAARVAHAVHYSSATPEWYTPQHIIQRVVDMFGVIDLDPCSNSRTAPNVPAQLHYTEADNGLALPWHGYVYMNPPYGDEIAPWIPKLIAEHAAGRVPLAVALVPARTDTDWFAPLFDYPICFVHGRLRFSGASNSAPFPSAVVYFGDDVDSFVAAFGDLGPIVVRRTQSVMGAM